MKIAVAAAVAASMLAGPSETNARPATTQKPKVCLEDQPCWSWSQNGNGARGWVYVTGKPKMLIVGVCRFRRLEETGRLDWDRTKHLKGDRWAVKHGCQQ